MVVILAIFPSLCAFPQVQPGPVCRLGRDQWPAESVLLPWEASIMRTQQIPEIDQMIIPISTLIVAGVSLSPLISLIAGILILIMPRLLNFIVAIYLIIIGLVGLFHL
jgi:hypothetical protein